MSQSEQLRWDPPPPEPEGELVFELMVPGRLPSWNDILNMEEWARYHYKQELADVFESALLATADDCSMKTISAKNIWLTYAATLGRYRQMQQEKRKSRLLKKKLGIKKLNELKFKSTKSRGKAPF